MVEYQEVTERENHVARQWLLFVEERKEDYLQARENILGASPSTSTVDISTLVPGSISDKTGNQGAALGSLQGQEKWLQLISEFEQSLPREKLIFLRIRRDYRHCRGKNGWSSAVQYRFARELEEKLGKDGIRHRNTYANWLNQMVQELAREALRRGLL